MKKNYDIILDPYVVIPFESRSLTNQIIDWGNTYSKASEIYNKTKGKGSVIFVLDTGAELTHSDLKDNALNQFGENFTDSTTKADLNGHSTLCSGLIAAVDNSFGVIGIAPESKIIPYKVLNDQGSGNYSWIANAIKRAADVDLGKEYNSYYRIISLSLGGNGTSKAVIDAVKYAISKDCIVVAAAGNSYYKGVDNVNFPASIEEVIAVASIDKYEKPSDFSSGGKLVDISAPGSGIYSTYLNNTYGLFDGTSFSCPYISGAIALLLTGGLGLKNQQEVSDYLKKYAKDIFDKGFDVRTGYGSVILPNYFNKEEVPDKPVEDNNAIKLLYHKSLNLAYNTDRIKGITIKLEVKLEINSTEDFDNIYLSAVKYFDNILNSFNNTLILSKADKLVSKLNGEKFIILQRDKANLRTIAEEIYKLMNVLPYKVTNFKVTSKDQCFSL